MIYFSCSISFPCTTIRLYFQSLVEDADLMDTLELPSPPPSSANSTSGSTTGNSSLPGAGSGTPTTTVSGGGASNATTNAPGMNPLCINIPTPHSAAAAAVESNYHSSPPNSPTGTLR